MMNMFLVIFGGPVPTHEHIHDHLLCANSAHHTYMWICHN